MAPVRTPEADGKRLPLSADVLRRPDAIPIQAYFHLARRHLRLLAVFGLIGLGVGLVAATQQKPVWVSGVAVLAPAIARDPQAATDRPVRPRKAMTLDSEAAVLLSERVLQRAVAGTTLTPSKLSGMVYVTAVPNSRVLRIQVRDTDAARAELLVGNLAAAYLDSRQQLLAERRSQQAESLRREIAALRAPSDVAATAYKLLKADTAKQQNTSLGSDAVLNDVAAINIRTRQLRHEIIELESKPVVGGELLRAASAPRRLTTQPEVPILSWLLVGLAVGGAVAGLLERRPSPPQSVAEVIRLPQSRGIAVGAFAGGQPVHDPSAGWVRMADSIGSRPCAVVVLPLEGAVPTGVIDVLGVLLRRRGYSVSELLDFDHLSADPHGAAATIHRVRGGGFHVLSEGPPLEEFVSSLSATEADGVVVVMPAGVVSQRRLTEAIDDLSRLGLPVHGVVLDQGEDRRSRWDRLTARLAS